MRMPFKVTGGEVVIARPSDGDEPGFDRVFQLLVAPPRSGEGPTVGGQQAQEVADFHGPECAQPRSFCPVSNGPASENGSGFARMREHIAYAA